MRKPINLAITTAMIVIGLQMVIPRSTPVARAARVRCPEPSLSSDWVKHSLNWLAQTQPIAGQPGSAHLPLPNPFQGFNSLSNVPLNVPLNVPAGSQFGGQSGPESNADQD